MIGATCALIGQGPQCIACGEVLLVRGIRIVGAISDCPELSAWLAKKGIARASTSEDPLAFLASRPIDTLFSIVNHALLSPEILALPKLHAINFHDSPLPEYSGFNATAWAILHGKTSHAVTWHEMSADVDGGKILIQREVPIAPDDTAFTLSAKCGEAAVRAFVELLDAFETGTGFGSGRGGAHSFHLRSERPNVGLLDFRKPAHELANQVRGLNFGPEDNWMCRAKVSLGAGRFLVAGEASVQPSTGAAPGCLLEVSVDRLRVAAADGVLVLGELQSLVGGPLSKSDLEGLVEGQSLPEVAALFDAALPFDAQVTRNERFWLKRLANFSPVNLSELRVQLRPPGTVRVARTLTGWLPQATREAREAALAAALATYLARVGNAVEGFDVGFGTQVPAGLKGLYAEVVPMRLVAKASSAFAEVQAELQTELALVGRRGGYARDVQQRYRALSKTAEPVLAVAMFWSCRLPVTRTLGCTIRRLSTAR
jgi:methionyl-tRNA formyltransferase